MFINSLKILFFFTLMIGTMITVSSNSWLSAWMGLEINLLSFIPLMNDNKNLMSSEASLKYFLTQALASAVLLFAIIIYMIMSNFIMQIYDYWINIIMMISLMLKSGIAPFHFWFPSVMEGLSWMNSLILMTWQKIAPIMLISYMMLKSIIIISLILSSMIGALGGFNQTSLRKLMAFSSINHLSWMLAALLLSENMWLIYFLFYSLLSFILIFMFNIFKLNQINQLFMLFTNSKMLKFSLFLNLLSLGGLPPFLGFAPKWILIQYLSLYNYNLILILLTSMTLITLYFYLRLCYIAFMLNSTENNWMMNLFMNTLHMKIYLSLSFISIFGLIMMNTIYFML